MSGQGNVPAGFEGDDRAPQLSAADAAAVDAWVDSGFDAAAVGGDRARRVAELLSKLATPMIEKDPTLADATFARVLRAAAGRGEVVLSGLDAEALDAWVFQGYDAAGVPASLRERAGRHAALAQMVCAGSVASTSDLAGAVMDRIEAAESDRAERLTFPVGGGGRGIRMSDLVSVAAVLLIAGSVVWPAMAAVRDRSRRAVCLSNLGNTGSAMAMYAGTNRDALPATAGLGVGRFWDVGGAQPHSNSANLYTLAREGYVPVATLACPGNPNAPTSKWDDHARDWRSLDEISYSYQLMSGPASPRWNEGAARPVLADRSPVIIRLARGEPADPYANAPNHRSAGQHLLLTDGSVRWITSPVLPSGDNIWLPRPIEQWLDEAKRGLPAGSLSGKESPAGADDTFLGP
ncbi:MAG: hypothetical protein IT437_10280 [Phycisphaerales bacterium]|nr:hypothetical protein [Phycisphaerales bacterium]